jgi:uncharacterized protein DUF6152
MRASIKTFVVAVGGFALALCAAVAAAHHSAAQFDFGQRVTIEGTVKEFNVTNPHTRSAARATLNTKATARATSIAPATHATW